MFCHFPSWVDGLVAEKIYGHLNLEHILDSKKSQPIIQNSNHHFLPFLFPSIQKNPQFPTQQPVQFEYQNWKEKHLFLEKQTKKRRKHKDALLTSKERDCWKPSEYGNVERHLECTTLFVTWQNFTPKKQKISYFKLFY